MPLRKLKPTSAGSRHVVIPDFAEITRKKPEKSLTTGLRKTGGRNNQGRITARRRGGGHKRRYRIIDFIGKQGNARVLSVEYDPNRTARIALIQYDNGVKSYMIAPENISVGERVECGSAAEIKPGNRLPLRNIPDATEIYNMEIQPGKGGQLARSAGCSAVLVAKGEKFASVKLPSGEVRLILLDCYASIGNVSFPEHKYVSLGKAGRKRWLGFRPVSRGVAMNPVDHPHGGGEGKNKGNIPVSPSGKPTKGYRTRKKNRYSDKFILQRRKK
ncbi:MAG: 50S ribosomal protein L2 [Candidatus Ratteibacteria bacterium]